MTTRPTFPGDLRTLVSAPAGAAPPISFGFLARLGRRWLGIADQQREFDALAVVLDAKDQETAGMRRDLEHLALALQRTAGQLGQTSNLAMTAVDRLQWHEEHVPAISGSKKAYTLALKRESKRRQGLVDKHPELSEEGKAYVMASGKLPPQPAPDTERTLSLVRETDSTDAAERP